MNICGSVIEFSWVKEGNKVVGERKAIIGSFNLVDQLESLNHKLVIRENLESVSIRAKGASE